MISGPSGARVTDAAALVGRLRALRASAGAYTTSWFADASQAEGWVAGDSLVELALPGCILVLRRDRDFHHLYHAAESPVRLREALASDALAQAAGTLVADLVDRPAALPLVVEAYAGAGFRPYSRLVRMSRPRDPDAPAHDPAADAEQAGEGDAAEVVEFFERLLDPYVDQIPAQAEIERLCRAGGVLVVRHGGTLGGVLVFEMHGQTAILRYWWVSDAARGAGIGARLIRTMFLHCRASARIVLWVVEGNENAISKYEHYGFRREGLVDQLMLRPRSSDR